jgi:hypothetical protein
MEFPRMPFSPRGGLIHEIVPIKVKSWQNCGQLETISSWGKLREYYRHWPHWPSKPLQYALDIDVACFGVYMLCEISVLTNILFFLVFFLGVGLQNLSAKELQDGKVWLPLSRLCKQLFLVSTVLDWVSPLIARMCLKQALLNVVQFYYSSI